MAMPSTKWQMAKTIYTAREYIRMDEIADKFLIGDQAFKAIIHSILIAKYGAPVLQVKFNLDSTCTVSQ